MKKINKEIVLPKKKTEVKKPSGVFVDGEQIEPKYSENNFSTLNSTLIENGDSVFPTFINIKDSTGKVDYYVLELPDTVLHIYAAGDYGIEIETTQLTYKHERGMSYDKSSLVVVNGRLKNCSVYGLSSVKNFEVSDSYLCNSSVVGTKDYLPWSNSYPNSYPKCSHLHLDSSFLTDTSVTSKGGRVTCKTTRLTNSQIDASGEVYLTDSSMTNSKLYVSGMTTLKNTDMLSSVIYGKRVFINKGHLIGFELDYENEEDVHSSFSLGIGCVTWLQKRSIPIYTQPNRKVCVQLPYYIFNHTVKERKVKFDLNNYPGSSWELEAFLLKQIGGPTLNKLEHELFRYLVNSISSRLEVIKLQMDILESSEMIKDSNSGDYECSYG